METIEINPQRLKYLVKQFGFTEDSFQEKLQSFYKKKITENIFSNKINLNYLKKIDKEIFKKGLSFYTDPNNINENNTTIFFRKKEFNSPLELKDRQKISDLEDEITYIEGLMILAEEKKLTRKIKIYHHQSDDPVNAAREVRPLFYPAKQIREDKDFLKEIINSLAKNNVFVLEFTEHPQKKITFDGCFISPNYIIIKRQGDYYKREIFTLAHELAHYLLDNEELDEISFDEEGQKKQNQVEKWCNQFAFAFLFEIEQENFAEEINYFKQNPSLENLSFLQEIHVSRLAFLTYLTIRQEISWVQYNNFKQELETEYEKRKLEKDEKIAREAAKAQAEGKPPPPRSSALEIISPLKDRIYKNAYFEGVIDEFQLINKLKLNRRMGPVKKEERGKRFAQYFEKFIYE